MWECKLHEGEDIYLFSSIVYFKILEECLTKEGTQKIAVNEWIFQIGMTSNANIGLPTIIFILLQKRKVALWRNK